MSAYQFISENLEFVKLINESGVLKIEHLRDRLSVAMKKKKWESLHEKTKLLGLVGSKNYSKTKEYWNKLRKNAEDNLCLLRSKQINKLNDLDRQILLSTGMTETELFALESASIGDLPIVKRERILHSEIIIDDDEDHESFQELRRKVLEAKLVAYKMKSYKLMRELNLQLADCEKIKNQKFYFH